MSDIISPDSSIREISDASASRIIRTAVPMVVGLITGPLAAWGLEVTDSSFAVSAISGILGISYYVLIQYLEKKYPKFSVFLGSRLQPAGYVRSADVVTDSTATQVVYTDDTEHYVPRHLKTEE